MVADHAAREAGQDRRPDRSPRPVRRLSAGRSRCAAGAVRRDPAPDRSAARTARADNMTVGDQMAEDEGRAMRKSPPEVCWSQSPRPMRPSLAVPDADIATAGGLPVDRNDAEPHCLAQQTGSSGESRMKSLDRRRGTKRILGTVLLLATMPSLGLALPRDIGRTSTGAARLQENRARCCEQTGNDCRKKCDDELDPNQPGASAACGIECDDAETKCTNGERVRVGRPGQLYLPPNPGDLYRR